MKVPSGIWMATTKTAHLIITQGKIESLPVERCMHHAVYHELLVLIPLFLLQFVLQCNENYLFLQAPQQPKRGKLYN
jgi:hypothetical protein